jgi:ankyrin repeat protein
MEWSDAVNAVQEGYIHELSGALAAGLGKATSEDGVTLLHWAAYNNRIAIARLLIESGADVNIKGGTLEETPLMWAMRRKFYAMGALLVESGAKFDIE